MVLEPPLLDAPAEEHAAVSAPMAASAAVARSERGRWSKRIVQSSPAVGATFLQYFAGDAKQLAEGGPHFARGTAQFAPDNHPDVRFDVRDVEQSRSAHAGTVASPPLRRRLRAPHRRPLW